jgi:hypothetical protein
MKSKLWRLWIVLAGLGTIQAQNSGEFVGIVTDTTGAAVAGAKVTATETDTGLSRSVNSGTEGFYTVPSLRPTVYKITVEAPGCRQFTQEGITLEADQKVTVNFKLVVGTVTETIDVNASATEVNTVSGTLSQVVDTARVMELPLNGRNPADLAYTVAGTVTAPLTGADQGSGKTFPEAVTVSGNGTRQNEANFLFDGGNNIDAFSYINAPFPFPDAVQEFSVQTSNFDAEHGMSAGPVISVVTKSGTNKLHGDLFEFVRNGIFDARNFFASTVDPLKRNQFGGTIGGPVVLPHYNGRDKTFFFFGYQGTQIRDVTNGLSAYMPTAANVQGNFSNLLTVNPDNPLGKVITIKNPTSGVVFPGNIIPTSLLNPASLGTLNYLQQGAGSGLVFYGQGLNEAFNETIVRLDHSFSDKDRLMGHYYRNDYYQASQYDPTFAVNYEDGVHFRVQNGLIGETHIFSPTLLNDFRFGYAREVNIRFVPPDAPNVNNFGVNVPQPAQYKAIECVCVSGFFSIGSNDAATYPRQTFTLSDTMRWIKGRNSFAFGFRGDLLRMDEVNDFNEFGSYTFTSYWTGYALSDFMLGDMSTFMLGSGENRNLRDHWLGAFVQDDLRVNRHLTFNFGLRWDPYFPWVDKYGRIDQFRPWDYYAGQVSTRFPNAPPGIFFSGDPGVPKGGVNPVYSNFAPRFGFAYDLSGDSKTVLRGGGGVFYDASQSAFFNSRMVDQAPWSPIESFTDPTAKYNNPLQGAATPLPEPPQFPPPSNLIFPRPVLAISENPNGIYQTPVVYNWNINVERQVAKDWLARVAYVGSHSSHLFISEEENPAVYTPGSTLSTDNRRIFQGFTNISNAIQSGNSEFNSLQLSLEKAFSHGLTLRANYTYSKSLDDLPLAWEAQGPYAGQSWVYPWYYKNADLLDRGPSQFNFKQRFVATFVWHVPFPAHANAILKGAFGGWETSGILTFQSGAPLTPVAGTDRSMTGLGNDRAVISGTAGSAYGTGACNSAPCVNYLNASSFSLPAVGTFGNVSKGLLVGPGLVNLDAGIFRNITIHEKAYVQFRAEFFNITNYAPFNNPNSSVSGGGFGTILSAGSPRIGQLALKFVF